MADLLKEYCGFDDDLLSKRIDKFKADSSRPSDLSENLDYGREIGNFSAHTMLDDEGNIIEVGAEEAEWALEIVDALFDYFIRATQAIKGAAKEVWREAQAGESETNS